MIEVQLLCMFHVGNHCSCSTITDPHHFYLVDTTKTFVSNCGILENYSNLSYFKFFNLLVQTANRYISSQTAREGEATRKRSEMSKMSF